MEQIMINGSYLVAGILVLVGIIKLPFASVKSKMGNWYTVMLTLITLVLAAGACVLGQIYLLDGALKSWAFVNLCTYVFAGVFISYNGIYEGLKLKTGIHKLWDLTVKAMKSNPESKLAKVINKVGLEKVQAVVNTLAQAEAEENEKKLLNEKEVPIAEVVQE